jgi:PAS domain S-box-containing protein
MKPPEIPKNEADRLAALAEYEILDTPPEASFDAMTRALARICKAPIALVSLVDRDRQWWKSQHGIAIKETPRSVAFCGHVVAEGAPLIVPDAQKDERFFDNPLVTGEPYIRFYAGVPLRTNDGFVLGALCIIDHVPRELLPEHEELLRLLADQVTAQLELRRKARELAALTAEHKRKEAELSAMLDHIPASVAYWDKDLKNQYANAKCLEWTGGTREELRQRSLRELMPDKVLEHNIAHIEAVLRGERQTFELLVEGNGGIVAAFHGEYVPDIRDGQVVGFIGLGMDITAKKQAALALGDSEARMRALLDTLPGTYLQFSEDGCFLSWHGSPSEHFGLDLNHFVGRNVAEIKTQLQATEYAHAISLLREAALRTRQTRQVQVVEFSLPLPDGRQYFEARVNANLATGNSHILMLNVTRRVNAEAQVRESEEMLSAVVNSAPVGIALIDVATGYLVCNQAMERIAGVPIESLRQHRYMQGRYFYADGRPMKAEELPFVRASTTGQPVSDEIVGMLHPSGAVAWAQVSVLPMPRHPSRFITIAADVTARLEAEADLRQKKARLRGLFDSALDAIVIADEDLQIQEVSPSFTPLFGYSEKEVIGQPLMILMPEFERQRHRDLLADKSLRVRIRPRVVQGTAQRKDGSCFSVEVALSEFADRGKRLYSATIRNVTERKRLEHHLSEHEMRLRSGIAYDLHDGVGQNLAGARLLLEGVLRDSRKEQQPTIERILALLSDALEQIRRLSRSLDIAEVAEVPLSLALVHLSKKTTALFGLHCKVEIAASFIEPPQTDKTQVFLVAQEASVNAARHSGGSNITITLDLQGDWYTLRIRDNGKGIPSIPSSGLGMTSMQYRARLLGGTLEVGACDGGVGAAVTLRWPKKPL